ncbi:SurA N-terminal domain-containing protein [Ruminiclostridium cellulolyticum]|uniref:SurA domain protein n=1 Tax=Ruminiclostridium cellulolyticum (strain ATCC 35319 / DSM 5812 / JCM 6584 / H10) TaxID=394503 RepID=B8HZU4_RUMCH|nr:SurA N-terminal domain-containing protein [Ruminiclostridium cellulolyticum]ACL75444.1 hypothetical protein Ccel_1085 [Ruminiclostridium cellulolyticum H10]
MVHGNNRKKVVIIAVTAVILIFGIVGYTFSKSESAAKFFGIKQSQTLTKAGKDIVATINGENITKKGFNTYKAMINSENKLSDKEILDRIVESHVVYTQAVKEGFRVSDHQVEAAIKSAREEISMDSKQYKAFKEYISGLKMSEDEYWESVKPTYKKALIRGAYKNALKQKFKKVKLEDPNEVNSKFSEFYDREIKDLISQAKIQSFLK